jgi:hypothetical protein
MAVAITQLVCSVILNTLWIFLISAPQLAGDFFSTGSMPLAGQTVMVTRAVSSAILTPVFALLLHILYRYRWVYLSRRMEPHPRKEQKQPV